MRRYRLPAAVWASVAITLFAVQRIVESVVDGSRILLSPGESVFAQWIQFDGWEYLWIAHSGYWYEPGQRANVVFFPLYSLAIRAANALVGDMTRSAVIVSAVAGLCAVLAFSSWLRVNGIEGRERACALGVMMLYPYSWYLYGVIYSDALFVALVVLAFLMVERDRLAWAGVLGALATATRPTGLALIPALSFLALERHGVLVAATRRWHRLVPAEVPTQLDFGRMRPRYALPLLSMVGVGSFAGYLWITFGDPTLFASNQNQYHGPLLRRLLKANFVGNWVHWEVPHYTISITVQALLAVGALASVPAVGRRFGWGYALFVALLVAIPALGTSDFNGTARYLLAAFPVAAIVGEWLAGRRLIASVWMGGSGVALVVLSLAFSRSMMLT